MTNNTPDAVIVRFRSAVHNLYIASNPKNSPQPNSTSESDPAGWAAWRAQQSANVRSALEELYTAAPAVLELFKGKGIDASAIYLFLRRAVMLRLEEYPPVSVEAALDNLRLHVVKGPPQLPAADLHETVKAALEYITKNPGQKRRTIAAAIGTSDGNFGSHIVPKLTKLGVTNPKKRGYFPPAR